MPIQAQSADGVIHEFPDGTDNAVIDKAMKAYVEPKKIPQQDEMGPGEAFMTGVGSTVAGAKQLATHIAGNPEEAQKIDRAMQLRNEQIAGRGGLGISGTIGEAVPGMLAGAAVPFLGAGIGASAAGGALGGAISGAVQPVSAPNYWDQKTDDLLMGTAFGAAGGTAVHALGSILAPNLGPAEKALVTSGVNLTPGQMAGGVVRRAEEAFKSLPILGSFIRGAEGRGIEGFNRGVLNQALEPIGQKLSAGVPVGKQALIETDAKLGAAYDALLPQMKLQMDHDLATDFQDVSKRAGELPKNLHEQFDAIMQNRVRPYFMALGQGIPLKGSNIPSLKDVTGALRQFANQYRSSGDPAQRQMAYLFDDVRNTMDKAVMRQNPQFAPQLQKIDAGWAMLARAEQAASRRATSDGIFTPADLLNSIKGADKSVRKRRFAQGKADPLLALYASYGQKVLPGKLPDSGTTERALYDAALLGTGIGAHSGVVNPLIPAGLALGSVPYTRPGMAAVNALARGGVPGAGPIGSVVRRSAAGLGALSGAAETGDQTPYGGPQQ